MRRLSLRGRMVLLVLSGVLPLLGLNLAAVYLNYREDRDTAGAQALTVARAVAHAVAGELNTRVAVLEVLALSDALSAGNLVAFRAQANAVLAQQQPGANILVLRADGQQLLNTALPPGAPLPARRALDNQRLVLETQRPGVSDLYYGRVVRRLAVAIDVPVRGPGALVAQIVSMNPSPDAFDEMLARQRPGPGWFVALLDGANLGISRVPDPDRFIGQAAPAEFRRLAAEQEEGVYRTVSAEGVPVIAGFARVPGYRWSVAAGVPLAELTRPAERAALAAIAMGLVVLLLGLALAQLVARGIIGPITRLRNLATSPDDGHPTPVATGLPEADEVAEALLTEARRRRAAMASLLDSERRLRLVVAELNHRAKNALATVQALAAQTARGSAGTDPARFTRTFNARLQSLARAHDLLTAFAWEPAALDAVVQAGLAPWLEGTGAAGPRFSVDCRCNGEPPLATPGQAQALVLALHELATNAAKHGALSSPTGRVAVVCRVEGETAVIDWRESDGPPVPGEPGQRGFGTRLLERSLAHDLGPGGQVRLEFARGGVHAEIRFAVRPLAARPVA